MTELPRGSTRDVAIVGDPVNGFAEAIYAATEAGLSVISAANPAFPEVRLKIPIEGGASFLAATDRTLYVACRRNGVLVFDLKDRMRPELVAKIPTHDARGLALASLHLFVADGSKGLTIADVADPRKPAVLTTLELAEISPTDPGERGAERVAVSFLNSRPRPEGAPRTRARQVAVVAGFGFGLHFVDVTEPARPFVIRRLLPRRDPVLEVEPRGRPEDREPVRPRKRRRRHPVRRERLRLHGDQRPAQRAPGDQDHRPRAAADRRHRAARRGPDRPRAPPPLQPAVPPPLRGGPLQQGLRIVDVSRSEQPSIAARLESVRARAESRWKRCRSTA